MCSDVTVFDKTLIVHGENLYWEKYLKAPKVHSFRSILEDVCLCLKKSLNVENYIGRCLH